MLEKGDFSHLLGSAEQQSQRAESLEDPAALPIGLEGSQVPRYQAAAENQFCTLKTLVGWSLSLMALYAIGPRVS